MKLKKPKKVPLLLATARTASVVAASQCDLFVLEKRDFTRVLQDNPPFADAIAVLAKKRYTVVVSRPELMAT